MRPMSIVPFTRRSCHFEFHQANLDTPINVLMCDTEPAIAVIDRIAYRSTSVKLDRLGWPGEEMDLYLKSHPAVTVLVYKRPRFLRTLFDRMLGDSN